VTTPAVERRVVLADDESLARERLRQLLSRYPAWTIVAECRNGPEAVEAILCHHPDVVFLDIRMPGLDGLEVADAIRAEDESAAPNDVAIVFVSAHDEFALRAFDVSAVDYLLKPIDRERFDRAVARLEARLSSAQPAMAAADAAALLGVLPGTAPCVHRFLVRSARGYYFVRTADVEWIEAEGNYAGLHAAGRTHLVRHTMKMLESRLDPATFVRVHRSAIVNLTRLARMEPLGHGEYRLHLESGASVDTSRAYSARVMQLLHG
jgi:two-component system LytT family response regulator